MRVTVGAIAVLGMAVTVAAAQPPRERAAVLKPPEPLAPGEMPLVARGAIDDYPAPSSLPTTPVTRPGTPAPRAPGVASGPAWLTGADPNLLPASGLGMKGTNVRPLSPPPPMTTDDPATPPRFFDRVKAPFTGDKRPAPQPVSASPAKGQPRPEWQQQTEQPTASTPYRGTGANGAPVFAGPPAYRWYGWGTVTPGANPLAPTGQYPKASANWYSITGATPGAFPVPVSNAGRVAPGTEPPSYGLSPRNPHAMQPAAAVTTWPQPALQYTERPDPSKFAPTPDSKFAPGVPTFTQPPLAAPPAVAPAVPAPTPAPAVARPEPVAAVPPLPAPPVPAMSPLPAAGSVRLPVPVVEPAPANTTPAPLPTSVTTTPPREEQRWQPSADSAPPPPGTWGPAPAPAPTPFEGQTGRSPGAPTVARGQLGDKTPDPIETVVKQVCQNRASGVEVRFTGTKKLQVCFEIRGAAEAQKLVNDISKRPELTAYQIDFCVLVK